MTKATQWKHVKVLNFLSDKSRDLKDESRAWRFSELECSLARSLAFSHPFEFVLGDVSSGNVMPTVESQIVSPISSQFTQKSASDWIFFRCCCCYFSSIPYGLISAEKSGREGVWFNSLITCSICVNAAQHRFVAVNRARAHCSCALALREQANERATEQATFRIVHSSEIRFAIFARGITYETNGISQHFTVTDTSTNPLNSNISLAFSDITVVVLSAHEERDTRYRERCCTLSESGREGAHTQFCVFFIAM